MADPVLLPDDETGAVYQAADRVLYTRADNGWFAFGRYEPLPFDEPTVAEGEPMYKLLDGRGHLVASCIIKEEPFR